MSTWNEVKNSLESFYHQAAHRTDRLARLGLRAYDRYGIHKDLDRQFSALGALTHRILSEEGEAASAGRVAADPRVQACMERIAQLQDELRLTQEEMEDLRRQAASGGAEGAEEAPSRPTTPGAGDPEEPPVGDRSSD